MVAPGEQLYDAPSFDELLRLAMDFGLVVGYRSTPRGIEIKVINQVFDCSREEAQSLLQGLLLGFFYGHNRNDLTDAAWS